MAARVLGESGFQLDALRENLGKSEMEGSSAADSPGSIDRSALHAMVDKLSGDRLDWLNMVIKSMLHTSRPLQSGWSDLFSRTAQHFQEGRVSANYRNEDGELIAESEQVVAGHKILVTERFHLSKDGKKLLYSHEVTGPKADQRYKHSFEFDVTA
jgi:hypothetical protein